MYIRQAIHKRATRTQSSSFASQRGQSLVEYLIVLSMFMALYLASGQILEWLSVYNGQQSHALRGVY